MQNIFLTINGKICINIYACICIDVAVHIQNEKRDAEIVLEIEERERMYISRTNIYAK